MFIGRKTELETLEKHYKEYSYDCFVIYGRRRIGKTSLINEFCKEKPAIIFSAVKGTADDNLRELSRVISEYEYGLESEISQSFTDLRSALVSICRLSAGKRLVFCIDELPYLAASLPSALSILQHFLDKEAKEAGLFIILCGSSISFMENGVLSEKSPIYGRRSGQIKLQPFDYKETAEWFPDRSHEEQALIYGITGGVPYYMECFSGDCTIREAVIRSILSTNGLLFAEPLFLLKEGLKDSLYYDSILHAIADGRTRLSEISSYLGIETGMCSIYLKTLISLGIIRKETPLGETSKKKTFYRIEDYFLLFWFRFVYKYLSVITSGRGRELYDKIIVLHINEYMGPVFERMAHDYILKYSEPPFLIREAGRWWGRNPKTKKDAEIDVVAVSAENPDEGIIASCKYQNSKVGPAELNLMKEYGDAMGKIRIRHYWMFSKSGYTPSIQELASDSIRLYTLEDLYL